MPVVFPHAGDYTIEDDVFRQAWAALLVGQHGAGPALPRLPSIKTLNDLIETTTAPGNTHPLSLEYLLRTLVPTVWRTTMQATNQFLHRNRHIVESTPKRVVNPVSGVKVQGVQLIPTLSARISTDNVSQIVERTPEPGASPVNGLMDQSVQLVSACNPSLIPNNVMTLLRQPTNYVFQGGDPWTWANHIENGLGNRLRIPHGPMSRADVRAFCRNLNNSDEACFIVVAAWGKMKTNHGQSTWATRRSWTPVLRDIRQHLYSRSNAYEAFRNLKAAGNLPGMGPAYFTKLIFFARIDPDAYIMDQWTGKSINLIGRLIGLPNRLPDMTWAGFVSDNNTSQDYERFNRCIESLANHLGIPAEECEQRLFSNGGHQPGIWRQYVRQNWHP